MYLRFTINPFHKKLIEFKALELPLNDELVKYYPTWDYRSP